VDDIAELRDRWVAPLYLQLLHGNFRRKLLAEELTNDREHTLKRFRGCVNEVTPTIVATLIRQPEWRARLVGSWYAGLRGWVQFRDELGGMLIESQMCFAGQGYCAALACFADDSSADHLCQYLDKWLPQLDKYYDQHWALPALGWIDKRLDIRNAERYLLPGGLWNQWASAQQQSAAPFYLKCQHSFDLTLASAMAAFG
jgi:hypothetical protein